MATNNSVNLRVTNNADGFDVAGGTTPRKITIAGGDISIAASGSNVYTFPTSTDTLVGRASTDTLTNKTLTAPKFADLGFIADANGNELVIFDTVTSAINELTIANAASGGSPVISATGGGTNIGITVTPKGTGDITLRGVVIDSANHMRFGGADGSAFVDIIGATSSVQGLRIQGDTSAAISFSTYVAADSFLRFSFLASGTMSWGPGSGVSDTTLARSGVGLLQLTGKLGIGVSPTAFLNVLGTTEQARLAYDASNYTSFTVSSAGAMTVTGTSGTSAQNFQVSGMPFLATNTVQTNTTATSGNLWITSGGGAATSTSQSQYLFAGASNVLMRVGTRGSTAAAPTADHSAANFVMGTMAFTEAGSGTHALLAGMVLRAPTVTGGAGATADLATLYIDAAPSGVTPTDGAYSIWVDGGDTRLDGNLILGTNAAGATAAGGVIALSNTATAPSASANLAHLYSVDVAASAVLGIYQETAPVVAVATASTHKVQVVINGTAYFVLLSNV